jgi:hypothetical protein
MSSDTTTIRTTIGDVRGRNTPHVPVIPIAGSRKMRTIRLMLLILTAVQVTGCGHSGQVEEFNTELGALAAQISLTIDAHPSVAGVQEAHNNLKSKQKSLLEKWNKLKATKLRPTEKTSLFIAVTDARKLMLEIDDKHTPDRPRDPLFNDALTVLLKEFVSLFDPPDVQ